MVKEGGRKRAEGRSKKEVEEKFKISERRG